MSSSSPHHKASESEATVVKDGGKFIIKPRALSITWGADGHYWKWLDNSETSAIELLQVCWLELRGSLMLQKLKKGEEYMVNFKVSMKPDAFGWTDCPVYFMAKPDKNAKCIWKRADLSTMQPNVPFLVPGTKDSALKFKVPNAPANDDKLLFGMYEIWKGSWKGGLLIHEVVIEPVGGNV